MAELCDKSGFDLRSAPSPTCPTYRQADFKPVDGSSTMLRTAERHKIDPREKSRLSLAALAPKAGAPTIYLPSWSRQGVWKLTKVSGSGTAICARW